ncbi:MAG: biotin--[acetyl-CoA-carboxylase] ligase [Caulobacterales bacterium]
MTLGATLSAELSRAPLAVFDELDSTKEEARRRAALSVEPGWILALRQTDGRGRQGREWQAPPGNLSVTGYCFHQSPITELPQLSFVAALAAYDCAAAFLPEGSAALSLKWPNDILLGGQKLAGLLLESGQGSGGGNWVSISVGMNLAAAPSAEMIGQAAACIAEHCPPPTPAQAARAFEKSLIEHLNTLEESGFATIRRVWLERAAGLGQSIKVQLPHETLLGVFEGLSEDGSLLLKVSEGDIRAITAGDVFFAQETD